MITAEAADMPDDGTSRTPDRLRRLPSRQLSQLTTRSDRLINEGLARVDARKWHYAVLASLQEYGPGSQAALSRRTGIYRSDMVGVLNELAERDLVERVPDPDDRRRNIITISARGRRRLPRLDKVLDDLHDELLAPLSPAERDQLTRLLGRLLDYHTRTAPPGTAPRRAGETGE
ncbi:MarR family winged helix-turn-helix transcriptional regulator [Embleya scabrispora]|uniref:MarR family winged helix-turn-helix transcriptional regulator n=1 Tax=Embleya scabrispora TaxID=159449 RepID=UPI0003682468|nr:MarR family winged helix-turn-helix transcriptional regulator [Embleya scabrispora]MYS78928.1 MarR family transcriptional regulator [Streptomyces sp. SID5474]